MSLTLIFVGAGMLYLFTKQTTLALNTGSKPRTNAFSSGKNYSQSLFNVNMSNGYRQTKAIGRIGTPKYYVKDRVGVMHPVHLAEGSVPHCDCRKDAPAH